MNFKDIMDIYKSTGSMADMLKQHGIDKNNFGQNTDKIEALFKKFGFSKSQVKSAIDQIEAGFGIAKHIPGVGKHLEKFDESKVSDLKNSIGKILNLGGDDIPRPSYDFTNTQQAQDIGASYSVRENRASKYPDLT